jgi:hypothetical protein
MNVWEIAEKARNKEQLSELEREVLIVDCYQFEGSPNKNIVDSKNNYELGLLHQELASDYAKSQLP